MTSSESLADCLVNLKPNDQTANDAEVWKVLWHDQDSKRVGLVCKQGEETGKSTTLSEAEVIVVGREEIPISTYAEELSNMSTEDIANRLRELQSRGSGRAPTKRTASTKTVNPDLL